VSADLRPTPPVVPNIEGKYKDVDFTTPTVELVNQKYPSHKDGVERAAFVTCNVTDEDSVAAAVKFVVEKYGRLDIMVNNAGEC
jgi:NAD(P)-dependent dehydrogenase (short-subunit alcohol dehydrogenase family)